MVPTKRVVSEPNALIVIPYSTKKRKTTDGSTPSKKQRQGKLPSQWCQLNLDVLYLIGAYILPRDLLNLARTCKSLRELLMDKSSKCVWKAARGQVLGLPDCPADLTEPEYAHLVFRALCHVCGKPAQKILWRIRRRYCPKCRVTQLRKYSSCDRIVHQHHAILVESITTKGEPWVDREQLESFLQEYHRSSNKKQFLAERRNKLSIISSHASDCERWEKTTMSNRKHTLELLRRERADGTVERLMQQGYGPEIAYHGRDRLYACHTSFFKVAKPLTDNEWVSMLPNWTEIMESLRAQRMDAAVYQPRRKLLETEYSNYVSHPSPDVPVFDILPHFQELLQFPPFRDVIHAPEGADLGQMPFISAFEKLPDLVEKWKRQLDIQLAELIKIPSSDNNDAGTVKCRQASTDKLHLACAMFEVKTGLNDSAMTHYPDVFSGMNPIRGTDFEPTIPIYERFKVSFLEVAPDIVKACGLDPNVATVEDMDRRNARFKCLWCKDRYVRAWRNAIRHATFCGQHCNYPRWEIIDDKGMATIQAMELKFGKNKDPSGSSRCLLCRPCVGDAMAECMIMPHIVNRHGVERISIRRNVHYAVVQVYVPRCWVRMAEDGTFEMSFSDC